MKADVWSWRLVGGGGWSVDVNGRWRRMANTGGWSVVVVVGWWWQLVGECGRPVEAYGRFFGGNG